MILKLPQTRFPSVALMTSRFKCGCLFSVGLQAQMKALLVRERIFILIRNVNLIKPMHYCMCFIFQYVQYKDVVLCKRLSERKSHDLILIRFKLQYTDAIPFNVKLYNLLEDASNHRTLGRDESVFDIATFICIVSDHKVMTSMTVPCRCSFSIPLKIITKNTLAVICLSKPGRSSQEGLSGASPTTQINPCDLDI